jgi:hypothetical protein
MSTVAEAPSDQAMLKFAGAHIDITPPAPVPLAGVEGRSQPWRAIATHLEANAFVLGVGRDRTLWVAADLLYFGPDLVDAVERCAEQFGVPGEQVIVAASHTHFAPATDRTKPRLGVIDRAYAEFVEAQLRRLVRDVLSATAVPVQVELARMPADLNVNRRRRWPLPTLTRDGLTLGPSTVMAPAPDAPRDAFVDALRFVDIEGVVRGVAWKFACHPVCFPDASSVSAEFPGVARKRLRQQLASDLPVLFLQGFTGDVRPWLPGSRSLKDRVQVLRRGPGFGEVALPEWTTWANAIAELLCTGVLQGAARRVTAPVQFGCIDLSMGDLVDAALNPEVVLRPFRVQRLAFGEHLEILFVAAEVCSPYLELFGAGERTLCVGYTAHVFGYLPSQRQVREGGYEGKGYFVRFGLHGTLRPGFERAVVGAVTSLRAGAFSVPPSAADGARLRA